MAEKYVVPTDAQAEYRRIVQRANRRVLSNLKYLEENGIRDNHIKVMLVGDFSSKKSWSTQKSPFHTRTSFDSEKAYKAYMAHVMQWGEDTGQRGVYRKAPDSVKANYMSSIYKALNGLIREKGISLEEWGGDLPPELKKLLEGMTLEQATHFFRYIDPNSGEIEEYDSDQVKANDVESFIDYVESTVSSLGKFYPAPEKKVTKKGKPKKSRRKKKGRKKGA